MREIRILLGKTGSGKSWRLKEMILEEPRVLLYDTLESPDYDDLERVKGPAQLCDLLARNPPIFRVAYSWDGRLPMDQDFDLVCRAVFCCRELTFAVEEIATFCSPQKIPVPLHRVVALGRHPAISFYCTSQTPAQIHSFIRSQASRIVSFNQTEPGHIDWCRAVMGAGADVLPTLADHYSLEWTAQLTVIRDPSWRVAQTINLHRTTPREAFRLNGASLDTGREQG